MKLISVEIENFRGYQDRSNINLADLTTLIGANDVGKSTWLEALEIFFNNNDVVKIEKADACVWSHGDLVKIACEFDELPDMVNLDAGAETTLDAEQLTTIAGTLKVEKEFDCSKSKPTEKTYIVCNHPTIEPHDQVLGLTETALKNKVEEYSLPVARKGNPGMRAALRSHYGPCEMDEVRILVEKGKGQGKLLWESIEKYLPIYALFQSDRTSKDSDDEVQNPLKVAIKTALAEADTQMEQIEKLVREKSLEIATKTHEALNSIDPTLASVLTPKFDSPSAAKWVNLFSLGMDTNDGIALNKRGSGIRRLILVSFFKAEAERRLKELSRRSVIYAIEEPETSQHPNNQKSLLESFLELSEQDDCQVILTTHSPGLASELPVQSIKFIDRTQSSATPQVLGAELGYSSAVRRLGIVPDGRAKVLICVEGPNDVTALKGMSLALHADNNDLPNLLEDKRFAFVPLGGETLEQWVTENYLNNTSCVQFHIYDNDKPKYQKSVDKVMARSDGSWASLMSKHEMECFLHSDAIERETGVHCAVVDHPENDIQSVPEEFAKAWSCSIGSEKAAMKSKTAKKKLARAFWEMTADEIRERDPSNEVKGWLQRLAQMAEKRPSQ